MFEEEKNWLKDVRSGRGPRVSIGRSPDNDLPVDHLAVSNYPDARVFERPRQTGGGKI